MIDQKPTTTNPRQPTMNEETKTPEPLAAILKEMRRENRPYGISPDRLRSYADRIEAAAERERIELREDEAKMLLREYAAAPDESLTPSALELKRELLRLAPAPGNSAALREALHECLAAVTHLRALFCNTDPMQGPDRAIRVNDLEPIADQIERATAALAKPARNADRFQTADEAVDAFADHLRAWENDHGIHSEDPDHAVKVPAGAFAWLFAPAQEGGDHA